MKRVYNIIIIVAVLLLLTACHNSQTSDKDTITVTIPPLKGLVEYIVEDDFEVNILLPEGATPESYSPTMSQMAELEESEYVFIVGTLPFEGELLRNNCSAKVIDLSQGVELITGQCQHSHHHSDHQHHGDPHIWFSLEELSTIVDNIDKALMKAYPDSTKYHTNSQILKARLDQNLQNYKHLSINAPKSILIYHPAMGYIANSLGINQIALENEGKSPTPSSLANVINIVHSEGIETMLYQKEYPRDIVEPIADILGVKLLQFNPLSEDIIGEIERVMDIILGENEQ